LLCGDADLPAGAVARLAGALAAVDAPVDARCAAGGCAADDGAAESTAADPAAAGSAARA